MVHPPQGQGARPKGTVLLVIASLLVLALAAGQGYVSWFAQFRFILAAKHADPRAASRPWAWTPGP